MIADSVRFKSKATIFGSERVCVKLSPNLSDSICVCIKSFLTVFIYLFIFIFMRNTHTHTKQTVSESLTEINNKQKKI